MGPRGVAGRSAGGGAVVLCVLVGLLAATACPFVQQREPVGPHVDLPGVAEVLRRDGKSLAAVCPGGLPAYASRAGEQLARVPGAERFAGAAASHGRGEEVPAAALPEPAFSRLLLERHAGDCLAPEATELAAHLEAAAIGEAADAGEASAEAVLEAAARSGVEVRSIPCHEGSLVVATLPGTSPTEVLDLLARGPATAAAMVALRAIAEAGVVPGRTVRLAFPHGPLGEATDLASCLEAAGGRAVATVALDGDVPVALPGLGRASWALSLPHRRPSPAWLAAEERRASRRAAHGQPDPGPPLVLGAGGGEEEGLPEESWMVLGCPGQSAGHLAARVRLAASLVAEGRPHARYDTEPEQAGVVVRARAEPAGIEDLEARGSALLDLAAVAVALGVDDPPGGSLASLLRAVGRLDGDPEGRRIGLHHGASGLGSFVVAPCVLRDEPGRAVLLLRLLLPPGLATDALAGRLVGARERLSSAAGHHLDEAELRVSEPSRVAADLELVEAVQQVFEGVLGTRPHPAATVARGLGAQVEGAVTVGLPRPRGGEGSEVAPEGVRLVAALLWRLAVATDPELERASAWR